MAKNDTTPPADDDKPADKSAAAAAAADEAQPADADTEKRYIEGTFLDVDYKFLARKIDSVQMRRFMQRGQDMVALDWLLGTPTMNELMAAMASKDDDAIVTEDQLTELFTAIGEASRAGNSESSSGS